ncbi:MAG: ABC transporter permease, partial [Phycisphaerae bacterium]|nr:ABC transporter permease [Phycisphaerae bacterium]
MVLVLVLLCAYFGLRTDNFFTQGTFTTIANQSADALVLAVGMTFVLIIGGIDLSVGSVLALCGAVLGVCLERFGFNLPVAIVACLVVGVACGAINGLVVIRWNIPSFIVTLGMMEVARGAAAAVTESRTLYIGSEIEVLA